MSINSNSGGQNRRHLNKEDAQLHLTTEAGNFTINNCNHENGDRTSYIGKHLRKMYNTGIVMLSISTWLVKQQTTLATNLTDSESIAQLNIALLVYVNGS